MAANSDIILTRLLRLGEEPRIGHNMGGNLTRLIIELSEKAENIVKQNDFHSVNTNYTGVFHNLDDSYLVLSEGIESFYSLSARIMMLSYRFLYDAMHTSNYSQEELDKLKTAIKTDNDFYIFVKQQSNDMSKDLFWSFGHTLENIHYSIYKKRNKGIDHIGEEGFEGSGLVTNGRFIHIFSKPDLAENDMPMQNEIRTLFNRMRGLGKQTQQSSILSKFALIDYNYFKFCKQDRKSINEIRNEYAHIAVCLPANEDVYKELMKYLTQMTDFISRMYD